MLKIYNTLTRKKEPFIPLEANKVRMYVCGMTTYSDAHIGHARTYVAFDIIRRYLEYKGYEVFYVQNITDIDDKIINAARERKMDALEYSHYYAERALGDISSLGVKEASIYPKASEHINEMIEMVDKLVKKEYAYVSEGDVYFSVEKFQEYGKLSGQNIKQIKVGARISPGEKKRSPEDFALWKAAKPGEPKWKSPWGEGRPGWHIECSVMSSKYLGIPLDIHGGGQDLIFPHHENEIAQAEAAYSKRFVNYWMHSGMLKVEGEKMSKSIGNIINVREALERWDAEAIRFFFASYHYRSPADFSEEALKNAENAVKRLRIAREKLEEVAEDVGFEEDELDEREKNFLKEVADYFKEKKEFLNKDNDMFSEVSIQNKKKLENAMASFKSLLRRRKEKILNLAFVASEVGISKKDFENLSAIKIDKLYTPLDIKNDNYPEDIGFPGSYPFLRGIHSTMHRGRLWTMRQFAGFGSAEETNQRYKYLLIVQAVMFRC